MAFITSNGRVLCYRDSGETALRPLLMAHPLGMSQQVWSEIANRLRGRFRCISWDLPGHGASAPVAEALDASDLARDARALLAHLDVPSCDFIGTSIGGVVGQALLCEDPQRVNRVVLTNTGAVIGTADAWNERAGRVRSEGLATMAGELSQRWFGDAFKGDAAAAVAGWTYQLERTDDESYARLCELLAQTDFRGRLDRIEKPVQLVAGGEDGSTPVATLGALAGELRNGRLETLDGIGHVPPVECPQRVADRLASWLCGEAERAPTPPTYEQGLDIRRQVLGAEHVGRAASAATTLDEPFQDMITRMAWGELWGNDDLSRSERSMITLAVLAALGRDGELELHLKTAKRIGLSEAQLRQALMHVAIYAGVPAANHAFKLAKAHGWGEPL